MKIQITRFFEAAHMLPDSGVLLTKQCAELHGHTYCAIITAEGSVGDEGMIVDFKGLKQIVDQFDHKYLNNLFPKKMATTAENIAQAIKKQIEEEYKFLENVEVRLCEGFKGEGSSWVIAS